ncbi:MAG: hypothetical protein J6Y20_05885 [Lachnospiraceae bacterium]|nr:hypothetical protein [Lachnospiraceae bacterium]
MTINDVPVTIPFRIHDVVSGHYIYSILDRDAPGDIPPDIAVLPVLGVMIDKRNGYMEIDTEVY